MKFHSFLAALAVLLLPTASSCQGNQPTSPDVAEVVNSVADTLEGGYVYPEKGKVYADRLRGNLSHGVYRELTELGRLADTLTVQLQRWSHDGHLRVRHPDSQWESPLFAGRPSRAPHVIFGIGAVEHLPGNVGLIDIRGFQELEVMEPAITEAMKDLEDTDALIFDLRWCRGGMPESIHRFNSYLLGPPPRLLFTYLDAEGDTVFQAYSHAEVPGQWRTDTPVVILTSERTYSGGEEFVYGMQQYGRAVVVGERTGGGGHLVRPVHLPHDITLTLPFMRPVHPVSGGYWEGTGVQPDIEVDETEAEEAALEYLAKILE